jgi:hypothetical protein
MIASLEEVIRLMQSHDVRCIVIGGWAAIIHGTARSTNHVDLVYARDPDNIHRVVEALRSWNRTYGERLRDSHSVLTTPQFV